MALCGGFAEGMNGTSGSDGGDALAPRSGSCGTGAPHNKRMHPTADTGAVIFGNGAARRVMRGVRPLTKQYSIRVHY